MKRFLMLIAPILLTITPTGCGAAGGPKEGIPEGVSTAAPAPPPGTSNEMASSAKKSHAAKPPRPPG